MYFIAKLLAALFAMLLLRGMAFSQIPIEAFAGNKKATIDVMFFKHFKNKNQINSRFLFFNKNRATIEYQLTSSTNLIQLGFTETISFNHEKLLGFAPVIVGQIFGTSLYTKIGIQFSRIRNKLTIFTWLVIETKKLPNIDLFFLGRYTPKLTDKMNQFTKLELVNTFPSISHKNYAFT